MKSLLMGCTLLSGISVSAVASAATFAPPPQTTPHLRSYSSFAALWEQWAYATPAANNPVLDTSGVNCAVNQPVPGVFFLAGTFDGSAVTRSCTVPVGTSLLIPLLNAAYFAQQTDPPEQRTEAFVRSQVTCVENAPVLALTVDGQALANPRSYLEKSSLFSVNLPAGNIFGVPPQVLSPSVDEGYFAFVEPLTPGAHTVHFTATSSTCGISENATYNLTVQGTVGMPLSCSGSQQLNLMNLDIQTTGVALTVSGNCSVRVSNSVLFGGTAAIVIHDQGHVIVENSVVGGGPATGGFAFSADAHAHGEYRNSSVLSPNSVREFAIVSDSGGNVAF
ncbi:MAG: hypothetical protein ABJB12_04260 [Pseudomonadota bacterium]